MQSFVRLCQHGVSMTTPNQPTIRLEKSADYRESYANSVQVLSLIHISAPIRA